MICFLSVLKIFYKHYIWLSSAITETIQNSMHSVIIIIYTFLECNIIITHWSHLSISFALSEKSEAWDRSWSSYALGGANKWCLMATLEISLSTMFRMSEGGKFHLDEIMTGIMWKLLFSFKHIFNNKRLQL